MLSRNRLATGTNVHKGPQLKTSGRIQSVRYQSLPYDRHRLSNEHRSGRGTSISFDFLNYALTNYIEPEHLALAVYYMFLFKITNGERDICIGMNTHTRYKDKLKSIIGLYESFIPLRCQLDRHGSFHELVEYVQEMATNCIKYSYFPLQHILAQHSDCPKPTFLDIFLDFITIEKKIMIGDSELCSIPLSIAINEDEDVIGILSIIMVRGAYCPLSSQDPLQRRQILVKETQSHLVLVHSSTRILFEIDIVTLNIDTIINNEENSTSIHLNQMSDIPITSENILFVIFTSGSTGIPKAVQLRHRNFTQFLRSFVYADILTKTDTIIQMARCSFDNHLLSLVGTLITGATLIMLRPEGHMDLDYLARTCFLQTVDIGQEGELVIGGVGIFAGYIGRDDLTAKVMINVNEQIFYKTGDLVRMDNNGLIHYVGRRDFQVKLRGQRIELQEIIQCLLMLTSITACVVIKWDENHLIAYVQSDSINVEQLRHYCQSNLPSHMIPSIFIILEKLPLSPNGKLDRKRLPLPDLSLLTLSSTLALKNRSNHPQNQLQKQIHDIWCEILRCIGQQISITANFFSIGGHSLLFIELYHRYQQLYDFDNRVLSIA
ncbi:unnamed protein product [Adineta steineri]|uniref:Carrier domain-containing protein n=1 Tax=Adineta steineri TaxID=433720 RepID=A0A819K1E5_9BILA|nr:unnamed protein product [Adineta steineri]